MQEYATYNIEQHPPIYSEYVKFLVLNHGTKNTSGDDRESNDLGSNMVSLQKKVSTMEKTVKINKDKQAATVNGLAQLKEKITAME